MKNINIKFKLTLILAGQEIESSNKLNWTYLPVFDFGIELGGSAVKGKLKCLFGIFFTINNIFMDLEKQFCLQGSKRTFNSRSNSVETTHVFWKRCKCQPRVLNVKKTRCSLAPSMRSEAFCEQITSGDVSGCVAFWFVKTLEMVEFIALPFQSSKELKIWSFHVVVVQGQQGNVQKSVMHVQSCCF